MEQIGQESCYLGSSNRSIEGDFFDGRGRCIITMEDPS